MAGIDALAARGATVMFGEVHGTAEVPRLVGDAVCVISGSQPVTLAIEQPRSEQAALDVFIDSAGDAADRERLLSRTFWSTNPYGLTSQAMLELIERVRSWRAAGRDVKVVAFDLEPDVKNEPRPRDAVMAELLTRVRTAEPDRVMIVLTGGYHARRTRGLPHDAEFEPMAWHMAQRSVSLVTFDVERAGGSFWACITTTVSSDANAVVAREDMECGTHPFSQPVKQDARRWYVAPQPDIDGYDGLYGVGPTTASPPATASAGP